MELAVKVCGSIPKHSKCYGNHSTLEERTVNGIRNEGLQFNSQTEQLAVLKKEQQMESIVKVCLSNRPTVL